jgi:branched-chain amino acid transport system ATP-binding protein
MNPALLSLHGVEKRFGGLQAIAGVDLTVRRGEICAIIGPNGAGKSTLFGLIAGEHNASAGQIFLAGRDITGWPTHAVTQMGVARSFQLVNLFDSMTVRDNIMVGADDHRRLQLLAAVTHLFGFKSGSVETQRRARAALDLFQIAHLADQPAATLSYGQQRLVAAARAFASEPRLLLLDEPAAGLTEHESEVLAGVIRLIRQQGITVLLVEHNVPFVMQLVDRVVVLNFGRKIAEGKPDDIRANDAVAEAYLGR